MATTTARPITRPLRTASEYKAAAREMTALASNMPKKGTPAYDRLDLLALLVEDYEERNEPPLPSGTPQQVVDFMLEQKGMKRTDLAAHMGGRGRVYDFFSGRRAHLSVNQVLALRSLLGISADLLLSGDQRSAVMEGRELDPRDGTPDPWRPPPRSKKRANSR